MLFTSSLIFLLSLASISLWKITSVPLPVRAASAPSVTISAPANVLVGSNFTFTTTFDNTSLTDTGFGPYIDLIVPFNGTNGVDGNIIPNDPNEVDGIDVISASYLSSSIALRTRTFPDSGGGSGCVAHPLTVTSICGIAGDRLVVAQLPFGSFVPEQPAAVVTFQASMSNKANLSVPLTLQARGGFYLGDDELDNPLIDPANIQSSYVTTTVTPQVVVLTKSLQAPEGETATGPNYPRTFTLSASIAPGQVINNFSFLDNLPNNLVYQSLVSSTPGCSVIFPIPSTTLPQSPNPLTINCGTVTGPGPITATYRVFVPKDNALNNPVIDPNSGDTNTSTNSATASGNWVPIDTRDIGGSFTTAPQSQILSDKSLAIQKSHVIAVDNSAPSYTPQDVIEYTLNVQVSDFFAFQNVNIEDIISDGQHFDTSFTPTLSYNGQTVSSSGVFNSSNFSFIDRWTGSANPVPPINGTSTANFNITGELISRSFDGKLIGGCVPTTGTADVDCSNYNTGQTTVVIRYRTIVQQSFTDNFPSGNANIDLGDTMTNNVRVTGDLLQTIDVTTLTGLNQTDTSASDFKIIEASLNKNIHAVNGNTTVPAELFPGDLVTYRLDYQLPTSDTEVLTLTDYLPKPAFDTTGFSTTFNPTTLGIPAVDTAQYGSGDTFHLISGVNPTLTKDDVQNSLRFSFPAFANPTDSSSLIQLLFTVRITDSPFADGLFLTNQAVAMQQNTNSTPFASTQINQIRLRQPNLEITKGIVDEFVVGNNMIGFSIVNSIFTPSPSYSNPIPFQVAGSNVCTGFGPGVINSNLLSTESINSSLTGVDGSDLVRYSVVIENSGGSGAFDLRLRDILPTGMQIPGSGLNLCVTDGSGATKAYTDLGGSLFGTGIQLNDPSLTVAGLPRSDPTSGQNVLILTYDLQVNNNADLAQSMINRAEITSFANIDGGRNIAGELFDSAIVTPTPIINLQKTLVSTSEPTANDARGTIGSLVQFQSTFNVPEGQVTGVQYNDILANGLALVSIDTINLPGGVTSTNGPTSNIITSATVTNSGRNFGLNFGSLTNINDSNGTIENITIDYTAVVLDIVGNIGGTSLTNNANLSFNGGPLTSAVSNPVQVVDPRLEVIKTIAPTTGDSQDTFLVTLLLSHRGDSTATGYDISLNDILPAKMEFVGSLTNSSGVAPATLTENSGVIAATWNILDLGQNSTITFVVRVNNLVTPGETITNSANINWSSLPGTFNTPQSSYNTNSTERNSNNTGTGSVAITNFGITKSITNTRINDNDVNNNAITSGNNVVIGEEVEYTSVITVPEGQTSSFRFEDTLSQGLAFKEIVSVTSNSGSITTGNAIPSVISGVSVTAVNHPGQRFTLDFGSLINSDTNNSNTESLTIVYRVIVINISQNQAGATRSNVAAAVWDLGGTSRSVQASSPNLTIVEPTLAIAKTSSVATAQAGDQITYTVTITNSGTTPALDVAFRDVLPALTTYVPVSFTNNTSYPHVLDISNLPTLIDTIPQIDAGQTLTLTYQVTVNIGVSPNQTLSNTGEARWTSLRGNATLPQSIYNTVSTERTGVTSNPGGILNDYLVTASRSITITNVTTTKTIITSSETQTGIDGLGRTLVNIGEIVRYRLVTRIPQSTTTNFNVLENIPAGLQYLNDGTTTVALISNGGGITSSTISGAGLNVTGNSGTVTPTFVLPSASIAPSVFADGTDPTFSFGNIINSDTDVDGEFVTVEFNALVTNVVSNQAGVVLNNTYTVRTGSTTLLASTAANSNRLVVLEPNITIVKSISVTPTDAGDPVQYQIVVTNNNGTNATSAYNLQVTDTLDSNLTLLNSSISPTLGSTDNSNIPGNLVAYSIPVLDAGQTFTITVNAQVVAGVVSNQIIPNTANIVFESLSGVSKTTNTTGSINSNVAGISSGPRNGQVASALNDYRGSSNVSLNIGGASITKLSPVKSTYAIGEIVDYPIRVTLAEGQTRSVSVLDQLPVGLTYLDSSIITLSSLSGGLLAADWNGSSVSSPSVVVGPVVSGNPVRFNFGNLTNSNDNIIINNSFIIRVRATVFNQLINQSGTALTNTARIDWQDAAANNFNVISTVAPITVVEPDLNLTKSNNDNTPNRGQILTYTLTVNHRTISNADAQELEIIDNIPTSLTFVPGSSVLPSGWIVDESNPAQLRFRTSALTLAQNSASITYQATVNNSLAVGTNIINSASLQWTSLNGNVAGERTGVDGTGNVLNNYQVGITNTAILTGIDLGITKTDNQTITVPGQTLVYQNQVTNFGNTTANGIVITETVPANTTFNSSGSTTGWSCSNGAVAGTICTFSLGSLNANTISANINFAVRVDNPVPAGVTLIINTVTVSDNGVNGVDTNPSDNQSSDTDTLDALPDMVITKTDGNIIVNPGQTLTYTLTITNGGNQTATGVVITDTLPAGVIYVSSSNGGTLSSNIVTWPTISSFPVGQTLTRTVTVQVDNPVAAGIDNIINRARVVDDGTNGLDPTPLNNDTTDTDIVNAAPDLAIQITDNGVTAVPGQVVVYNIDYTNIGVQNATGVVVSVTVPVGVTFDSAGSSSGWSCPNSSTAGTICNQTIGALNVNANGSRNFAVRVNNPLAAGINNLNVTTNIQDDGANGVEIDLANNQASEITPLTATPDISITKTDLLITVIPGQTLSYTLTISNNGNQDATGVVVEDILPNLTSYVNSSNSGVNNSGIVIWPSFNLAAGNSVTRTVTITLNSSFPSLVTNIVNEAEANDDGTNGSDPTPLNNFATDTDILNANPDLVITKTDSGTIITPGQNIIYVLNYLNNGNQTADNVIITEVVPANTVFVSTGSSAGWSCLDGAVAGTTCTLSLGSLLANQLGNGTFVVLINDPLPSGVSIINNRVEIADDGINGPDPTPLNNNDEEITSANPSHDLSIFKTDNQTIAVPGETLEYTINYGNSGNQNLTGVVITETVPQETTFNLSDSTVGWSCSDGAIAGTVCTFLIGDLAAGITDTITFAVTIKSNIVSSFNQVSNSASIDDDGVSGPDEDPSNNVTEDVTTLDSAPNLRIIKTDGLTAINQNDTVTYTLTISNVGNQDSTGVLVTDNLPSEMIYVSSSDSGVNLLGVVTWPIFDLAVGQSRSLNVTANLNIPGTIPFDLENVINQAEVDDGGTNGPDLDPSDNLATDIDTVIGNPDLFITKTDNQSVVQVGDSVVYNLNISNVGNQDASLVVITETVPAESTWQPSGSTPGWVCSDGGIAGSSCSFSLGILAGGGNQTVNFGILLNGIQTTDSLVNTASVDFDPISGLDPTPENNQATDTDLVEGVVDLQITKTNNQTQVEAGMETTYQITVTNNGNILTTGITTTDTLPTISSYVDSSDSGFSNLSNQTVTWSNLSLLPGQSKTYQLTILVSSNIPAGVNNFTNLVVVVDDGNHGDEINVEDNEASDTDILIAYPDLLITITTTSTKIYPGEAVPFVVNYSNIGKRATTGVILRVTIPINLKANGDTTLAGWTCGGAGIAGDICEFNLGPLGVNQTGSVQLPFVTVSIFDSLVSIITIPSLINDDGDNGPEITMLNNQSQVDITVPRANLIITKTPDKNQVKPQELLNYNFVFRNLGPDNATQVVMQDILPSNLQFIQASRGGVIIDTSPVNNNDGTTTLIFQIGGLLSGQEDNLVVATRIKNFQANVLINEVSIRARESDPEISNNRSQASVTILPDPSVSPLIGLGNGIGDLLRTGLVGVDVSRVALSIILMLLAGAGLSSVILKPKKEINSK